MKLNVLFVPFQFVNDYSISMNKLIQFHILESTIPNVKSECGERRRK